MSLDAHLSQVEKYGFPRTAFPLEYHGHRLTAHFNDGHDTENGRVRLKFMLLCERCDKACSVRGRLPYGQKNTERTIALAKITIFHRFLVEPCT